MFTFGRKLPQRMCCERKARFFFRSPYAASFVTRDRVVSLACDPTIFISCQS